MCDLVQLVLRAKDVGVCDFHFLSQPWVLGRYLLGASCRRRRLSELVVAGKDRRP